MSNKYVFIITLTILSVIGGYYIYKIKNPDFIEETEPAYPVTPQPPDIVVGESEEPPSDFPKDVPVFPDSTLLNQSVDSSAATGVWLISQELPIAVAWYMEKLYDSGYFMTELPDNPLSETDQTFTASKEGKTISVKAVSEGNETRIFLEASL